MGDIIGLSTGFGEAIRSAEKIDKHFEDWIKMSQQITTNLKNAFSQQGGDLFGGSLSKAQGGIFNLENIKIANKNFTDMLETLMKITNYMSSSKSLSQEMFDPTKIYASNESLTKLQEILNSTEGRIEQVSEAFKKLYGVQESLNSATAEQDKKNARSSAISFLGEQGITVAKNTSTAVIQAKLKEVEEILKAEEKGLIEEKRIAEETIKFNSSTAAEQIGLVRKTVDSILKEEERKRKEIQKSEEAYAKHSEQMRQNELSNSIFAAKEEEKRRKESYKERLADIKEAFTESVEGATYLSDDAKSIKEQKEAIKYLIIARDNLSSSTQNYDKIIKDLNKRIQNHRINIEQATKAEENENTILPKVANEYARILKEIDNLTEARQKLVSTKAYTQGDAQAVSNYAAIEARLQDLNARRQDIEDSAQGQLDEIQRKHLAIRAQDNINAIAKQEEETRKRAEEFAKKYGEISRSDALSAIGQSANTKNIAQAEKAIQDLKEARGKLDNTDADYTDTVAKLNEEIQRQEEYIKSVTKAEQYQKEQEDKANRTMSGAMSYSKKAKSIEEVKRAMDYLQSAMNKEDISTKKGRENYKAMSTELERLKKMYTNVTGESMKFSNVMESLGGKLKTVFSLTAIQRYVNEIVKVRKEFELQNRALQAILMDANKANALWDKTVALAVQSPFTVKQLVTYTKQLAAYRIESDKLYDTTKMLADVSAGLGVDMDRLILAYGQVRAASFLRGTELRQFTEAGIPMLEELAKRFTDLEGKTVSVGEVFSRISKRMVSFNDVAEVFKNLTEEGGTFYRMQEIQAETLYGQLSNLRDAMDIMFNEIGKANDGVLKNTVSILRSIISNFREWAALLKIVGLSLAAVSLKNFIRGMSSVIKYGDATIKVMKGLTAAGGKTVIAFNSLAKTVTSHPFVAAGAAIVSLGTILLNHISAVNATNKKYDELAVRQYSGINKFKELSKTIEENNAIIKKNLDATDDNAEAKKKLQEAQEANKTAVEELNKLYPESTKLIKTEKDGIIDYNKALQEQIRLQLLSAEIAKGGGAGFLYQDIQTNYNQASESLSKVLNQIESVKTKAIEASIEIEKQYKEGKITESEYKDTMSILDKIASGTKEELLATWNDFNKLPGYILNSFSPLLNAYNILMTRNQQYGNSLGDLAGNIRRQAPEYKAAMASFNLDSEEGKKDAAKWVDSQLDALGIVNDEIVNWAREEIEKHINVQLIWDKQEASLELTSWRKAYMDLFGGDIFKYTFTDDIVEQDTVIDQLNSVYKDTKELVERMKKAAGAAYSDMDIEAETKKLEQLRKQLTWFGVDPETTNAAKSQTDWIAKMISLVKDMNKSYGDLNKTFDNTTSEMNTMTSFKDAFNEIFKDTDISLFKTSIDRDKLNELIKEGHKAGSVFSDAMLEEMEKMAESGNVIRSASDEFIKKIMSNEGFKASLYDDSTGALIKNAEDFSKKVGTATIGIGHAVSNLKEAQKYFGKELSEDESFELLKSDIEIAEKALNKYLDKYPELVLTQEQYDALLDKTYQGGDGFIKKALEYASDTDSALSFFDTLSVKLNNAGKNFSEEFGEDFIDNFKEANTLAERLAMVIETMNLTTKASGSKIDNNLYKGMKQRAKEIADLFRGDLAFSNMISQAIVTSSNLDITTPEGVAAFLEKLLPYAKTLGSKYVQELQKAIADYKVEIGVTLKQDADKDIIKDTEALFDRYTKSLELKELQIPSDIAKDLFKVDYIDLKGLRKELEATKDKFIGTDMEKEYEKFLEKLNDLEVKASVERMKTYSKYLYEGMSERVKLKIEELKKLKEVEESPEFQPQQKERIKEGIRKDASIEQQKQMWTDFKNSEMYTMMFEDMENMGTRAVEILRNKLQELKSSLSDLPANEMKEVINQLNKADELLMTRNPFRSLSDSLKEIRNLKKSGITEDVAQENLAIALAQRQSYEDELNTINTIIASLGDQTKIQELSNRLTGQEKEYLSMSLEELEAISYVLKFNMGLEDDAVSAAKEQILQYTKARQALKASEEQWNSIVSLTKTALSSIKDVVGLYTTDTYGIGETIGDAAGGMLDLVAQGVQFYFQLQLMTAQAELLGTTMNAAIGPIGWIVLGIQSIATILKSIAGFRSAKLQKAIDKHLEKVEILKKRYESLQEQIDKAYSTRQLEEYYKTQRVVTQQAIAETQAAINALEAAKKKNKEEQEQLQDLYEQLADLKNQIEEITVNAFSDATAGVLDSTIRAAEEFTDAWLSAFEETGDGLGGLEENFDDMLMSIAKKQAANLITGEYVKRWENMLKKYIDPEGDDLELTVTEAQRWAEEVRKTMPELSEALEAYLGSISSALGGGNSLSGLEKGIQGMTEEQADILASYWNSVRQYVANIDTKISTVIERITISDSNNPTVEQLKVIARQTTGIYDLLDRMTGNYPQGGIGLKVVMEA